MEGDSERFETIVKEVFFRELRFFKDALIDLLYIHDVEETTILTVLSVANRLTSFFLGRKQYNYTARNNDTTMH